MTRLERLERHLLWLKGQNTIFETTGSEVIDDYLSMLKVLKAVDDLTPMITKMYPEVGRAMACMYDDVGA